MPHPTWTGSTRRQPRRGGLCSRLRAYKGKSVLETTTPIPPRSPPQASPTTVTRLVGDDEKWALLRPFPTQSSRLVRAFRGPRKGQSSSEAHNLLSNGSASVMRLESLHRGVRSGLSNSSSTVVQDGLKRGVPIRRITLHGCLLRRSFYQSERDRMVPRASDSSLRVLNRWEQRYNPCVKTSYQGEQQQTVRRYRQDLNTSTSTEPSESCRSDTMT